MAWDLLETSLSREEVRQALEDYEAQAGVASIDDFGMEVTGPNRMLIRVIYTEA